MLRKLCLPFSPYRQRPDITLHGHGASRTVIPAQGPSGTLAEVRRISRPESGPVSYQITIRDRDLRRAAVLATPSKRLRRPPPSTGRICQPSRLGRYSGCESAIRVGFGHGSSEHAARPTQMADFAASRARKPASQDPSIFAHFSFHTLDKRSPRRITTLK